MVKEGMKEEKKKVISTYGRIFTPYFENIFFCPKIILSCFQFSRNRKIDIEFRFYTYSF